MPVYEYEVLGPDGSVSGILEVEQRMSDPPLTAHPETGAPLRRILSSTFALGGSPSQEMPCGAGACVTPGAGACFGGGGACGGGGCDWN